jgi:hypothetical protein
VSLLPVFVDTPVDWGWRLGPNAHLCPLDDSPEALGALHAVAAKIGLRREWFQSKPTWPHYDLTVRRAEAARREPNVVALERTQDYIRMRKFMKAGSFKEPGSGLQMAMNKWYVVSDSGGAYSPDGFDTAEAAVAATLALPDDDLQPEHVSVWRPERAADGIEDANVANVVRGLDLLVFWTAQDAAALWKNVP